MRNERRGEIALDIDGKSRLVVFDWDALARLESELGEDFDQKIAQAGYKMDLKTLAIALAAGFARDWPDVTPDQIKAAAPPVVTVMDVLSKALNLAFYGSEEAPEATENPPETSRPLPSDDSSAKVSEARTEPV